MVVREMIKQIRKILGLEKGSKVYTHELWKNLIKY